VRHLLPAALLGVALLAGCSSGDGDRIALAGDGRQVLLDAVSRCQLVPEQNEQSQQYALDLGFTGFGTGVACEDADGVTSGP
jgi:hypothetical protein